MADVVLRPGQTTLADWRAIYRGARVTLDPACHAAVVGRRAGGRGDPGQRRTGLRHQHRVRPPGEHPHRTGGPRHAPAQHRAVARGRRWRADAGTAGAAHAGIEAGQPRPGSLGRAAGNSAVPGCDVVARPAAGRADAGFRRCVRRSGAIGPHGGGDDRRRRDHARGRTQVRCRGTGAGRHAADRARRQGGTCAAERHAVLHRLCARRTVRGGNAAAGRPDHRRAVDRCRTRIRCAIRSAYPRAARPSRTDRRRPCPARADRRQRDPCLASHRR